MHLAPRIYPRSEEMMPFTPPSSHTTATAGSITELPLALGAIPLSPPLTQVLAVWLHLIPYVEP